MKKILSIVLVITLCLSVLTACGKSEATKNAEKAIAAIGEVTIDSKEAIANAEKLYGILTDDEKADVENRLMLVEAQEAFSEIQSEVIYENAKDAYNQLNDVAELCESGMDDIYGAWYWGIYEAEDVKDWDSVFYMKFSWETPNLTDVQLEEAAEHLGYTAKTIGSDWQLCVYVAEVAIALKGDYDTIEEKMRNAEDILQELTETYDDYTYYPKLKEYYSAVSSYVEFFQAPTGSFQQLSDTVNSYETAIRTYKSDVGFLFTK